MLQGRVVAVYGRHFQVDVAGTTYDCVTRGKKGGIACGDQATLAVFGPDTGVIERIEPRRNLLYRAETQRNKLIAANIDQALVVVASVPRFREELLTRCLVACEAASIPAHIIVNKGDLPETAALADYLRHYAALGYRLIVVSAHGDLSSLQAVLAGQVSVLVGASGVGKSSLLNRLVPGATASTGEISTALNAGRHTTTYTRLYALPMSPGDTCKPGALIDSPGMQEFGLAHLDEAALKDAFPEIRLRSGQCRFYNCRHLTEPGCAITTAAAAGEILNSRLRLYQGMLGDL